MPVAAGYHPLENLVVLDRLRTRHDGGVAHGLVLDLAGDLVVADAIVK